jgi:tetratricopeptide (TPR) repeat protein
MPNPKNDLTAPRLCSKIPADMRPSLNAALNQLHVPLGWPDSWGNEPQIHRCYPSLADEDFVSMLYGRNRWTTHSRVIQAWLQAGELQRARDEWRRTIRADPGISLADGILFIRSWYEPKPTLDDLGETRIFFESLLERTRSQDVAVDLAWTVFLQGDLGATQGLLSQFDAQSYCPTLAILLGDLLANAGNLAAAFDIWDWTVNNARSPLASLEIGHLLLRRTQSSPLVFPTDIMATDTLRHPEWTLLESAIDPHEGGLRSAVKAYGRALRYYDDALERQPSDADDVIESRAISLDGFVVACAGLGEWGGVASAAASILARALEAETDPEWTFCERALSALENIPIEKSKDASHVHEAGPATIFAALAGLEQTILEIASRRIEVAFGESWEKLGGRPQQFFRLAEVAFVRESGAADLSSAIVAYRRAIESLVGEIEGRSYVAILGDYGDLTKLLLAAHLRGSAPVEKLTREIREFTSKYGNPAAHGSLRDVPEITRGQAEVARRLAISLCRDIVEWLKL